MSTRYYRTGIAALFVLLCAVPVFAQEENRTRAEVRADVRAEMELKREEHDVRVEARTEQRAEVEANREERRDELEANREARVEERAERQAERRANLSERAKDRIEGYIKRIVARMSAMAERLDNIANRLDARLEVIAETGVDTTDAEALLAEARSSIDAAEVAIRELTAAGDELVIEIGASVDADASANAAANPRETLLEVKELAAAAREALKTAHTALVSAVEGIKSLNLSASVLNSLE